MQVKNKVMRSITGVRRRILVFGAAAVVAGAGTLPFVGGVAHAASQFHEYAVPTPNSGLSDVAVAPDGSAWFVEGSGSGSIGKVTTSGVVTEYPVPAGSYLQSITAGPDGNMWFTMDNNAVGYITPSGSITTFATTHDSPTGITAGPDGNLWFTMWSGYIGKVTTSGVITEYRIPAPGSNSTQPRNIVTGPDGALWFTQSTDPSRIGRITTNGDISQFSISDANIDTPYDITVGSDGALWWTNNSDNYIGRMTTSGATSAFNVGTNTLGISAGSDGNLWFTEPLSSPNKIVRMTTSGVTTSYTVPTATAGLNSIAAAANGTFWFTESRANNIGRLTVDDTRPTLAFTAPSSFAGPFPVGPTVSISASDTSGLGSMAIHVYTSANVLLNTCGSADAAELAAGSMSCDLSALPSGSYYIKAGAFDTFGNNRTINSGNFTIGS
jgi:streptogramin lyase